MYVIDRFEKPNKVHLYQINTSKTIPNCRKRIDFSDLKQTSLSTFSSLKYLTLGIDFEFDGNEIKFLNQ